MVSNLHTPGTVWIATIDYTPLTRNGKPCGASWRQVYFHKECAPDGTHETNLSNVNTVYDFEGNAYQVTNLTVACYECGREIT